MIENIELAREWSRRAYILLANLYGIHGELDEIKRRIREYVKSADQVIDYLKGRVLADYSSNIEISNEIETADNPFDLLLIPFNNRYYKMALFESAGCSQSGFRYGAGGYQRYPARRKL